jgi:uncharacterized repeat protein (TIGR01451 family)
LKTETNVDSEAGVLFVRKAPSLAIETVGPRRISVGKEAVYQVLIQNAGEVAAEDVTVFVTLPPWAEVAGAEASVGTTHAADAGAQQEANAPRSPIASAAPMPVPAAVATSSIDSFQWKLGRIESKGREKLTLRIIPRESRPFDLAVRWDAKPVPSQATIEVQEAKLALRLDGAREVHFGQKEVYKLRLSNTGNGPAENLAIHLLPVGGSDHQAMSHKLGTLAAGEERVIEVELTARQAGTLTIQVDVRGDGGLHAELTEKVLVQRAALRIEVEGPSAQFVNTVATYRVRVHNTGTAAARHLKLSATLPAGAKYVSGSEGAHLAPDGGKVQWSVENLDPDVERALSVKCALGTPGAAKLEIASTADDELSASAEAVTRVDGVADLRLDVKDPDGPVAVGEEAVYDVKVRNRGTKAAQDVEVMTYFSAGIEPISAEGRPHRLAPGQVVFTPIATLAAGAEVSLRVRARADAAGNHVFRAEIHCKTLGTRLVREETTQFYQNESLAQRPLEPVPSASGSAPDATVLRAADRRHAPAPSSSDDGPDPVPTPAPPRR